MNKQGFTSGPWVHVGKIHDVTGHLLYCGNVSPVACDHYRGPIADIQSSDHLESGKGISREEAEANARLIAAAPTLLAVCQEMAESAAYWSEYDVPLGLEDRLNAAIAAATHPAFTDDLNFEAAQ